MDITEKLEAIQMLLLDVDGVLTDGCIIMGNEGELCKNFNAQDGMGVSIALRHGISVGVITGRYSKIILHRAEELGIELLCAGVKDKAAALRKTAEEAGLPLEAVAFMGDDLNDLPAMEIAGVAFAPANGVQEVRTAADYVAEAKGGQGAVREVIEKIMRAQGQWEKVVNEYRKTGQGDNQ